jgi:transposase-like protein
MSNLCYRRHRFPVGIIQHAIWLYFRFPLSFRDVEDLLAERGIDVLYQTVRRWLIKFGLAYARGFRRSHPPADVRWHLDEMFVSINGVKPPSPRPVMTVFSGSFPARVRACHSPHAVSRDCTGAATD